MLKFKREDVGLYFALGLVGGGIGLLIGAFIASRIEQKRELAYLEEDWESPDIHVEDLPEDEEETLINPVLDKEQKRELKRIDALETEERVPAKSGRMSRGRVLRLTRQEERELKRLCQEYSPSEIQIDLVNQGIMTVEDLELSLIEEEMSKMEEEPEEGEEFDGVAHTDYSKPYRVFEDNKPDMDELLPVDDIGPRDISDLLVTLGGRYEITIEPPEGKHQKNKKELLFDSDGEKVYKAAKSGEDSVVAVDIGVMISPEVKETIWDFLLFEDVDPIYINDLKGSRWYEITRDGTEEDGSEYEVD